MYTYPTRMSADVAVDEMVTSALLPQQSPESGDAGEGHCGMKSRTFRRYIRVGVSGSGCRMKRDSRSDNIPGPYLTPRLRLDFL